MKLVPLLAFGVCLSGPIGPHLRAQTYRADALTVQSVASPVLVNRLFRPAQVPAPTNSCLWFVADTAGNGVPSEPPANAVLGPDDVLLHRDVVDGQVLGAQNGRFQRNGIEVAGVDGATAAIYVYLWDGDGVDFQPGAGATFGLFEVGIAPPPQIGNASWWITADVVSGQYTVGPAQALPPTISSQPADLTVKAGDTATLTVVAAGALPLAYQWRRGDLPLAGETNAWITLSNVTLDDAGTYRVEVTNSVGAVTSDPAVLTVESLQPPMITGQPTDQTAEEGGTVTFTVTASGEPPLYYQWLKDAALLEGATDASLTLTNLAPADAGLYQVVVSNSLSGVTSDPARLTVQALAPPEIVEGSEAVRREGDQLVFEFQFGTEAGSQYQVQAVTNLSQTPLPWLGQGEVVPGDGTPKTYREAIEGGGVTSQPGKFYRVQRQ